MISNRALGLLLRMSILTSFALAQYISLYCAEFDMLVKMNSSFFLSRVILPSRKTNADRVLLGKADSLVSF